MLNKSKILSKKILSTLGPASLNAKVISRLEGAGVSLFRINLSHTRIKDLEDVISEVRKHTDIPICLDTEGAQVRTGRLQKEYIHVLQNNLMHLVKDEILGDDEKICLTPKNVFKQLKIGDLISIDFNAVLVQIVDRDDIGWVARVITGGQIGNNKAVTIDREINLNPLTEKDESAIKIGIKLNINHFALSFANKASDVQLIRNLVGLKNIIISKIETIQGIQNLEGILDNSNAILIDRGDLSRQVPIEQIPRAQKEIIKQAKEKSVQCYVATNLLESMINEPNPTRAEVNDIFNTLEDGADGLVLAAETAIGRHPVSCANMICKLILQFEEYSKNSVFSTKSINFNNLASLVAPHGGSLVNRIVYEKKSLSQLPKIHISDLDMINVEQIAIGSYSPLEGFLTKNEVESVLNNYKLQSGIIWTLPIMLQVEKKQLENIKLNDTVALCLEESDEVYAQIKIDDLYSYNLKTLAKRMFCTNDESYPGVKRLVQGGNYFIGGKIKMFKRLSSKLKNYEITPKQTRTIFTNKNWVRILGFQSDRLANRAYEDFQIMVYDKTHCDGLLIQPTIGPAENNQFLPEVIIKSYEIISKDYLKELEILISAFQNFPRYFGPREVVFNAICMKNFGCSHVLIDRTCLYDYEHYQPDEAQKLFEKLGNIGIELIFFDESKYTNDPPSKSDGISQNEDSIPRFSVKEEIEMLENNISLPGWHMRNEISKYLLNELSNGNEIFS